jgi:hypothetical protein
LFVLLAVEKNEQRKRISITRTFFDRERKSFVSPYPASRAEKNSPIPKTQAYKKGVEK